VNVLITPRILIAAWTRPPVDATYRPLNSRRVGGPHNRLGHCGDKSVGQEAGWASEQAWPALKIPWGCRVSKPDCSRVKPLI